MSKSDVPENEIIFDEIDKDIIDNDTDGKLNDWLQSNDISLNEIQVTIYRWDNAETGADKTQVDFIRGDLPDKHTIGLKHGAGKYTVIIVKPKTGADDKRKITSRTFKLGDHYNTLMQEEKLKNNPYGNLPGYPPGMFPPVNNQQNNNSMDMIKVMSLMMQNTFNMLTPILAAAVAPRENGNGKNDITAYSMIDKILQNNAKNNIEFYGELQKKIVDNDLELQQAEKPGIIEQLLPVIDKFIPMFSQKQVPPGAEETLKAIKASEQYKEITDNRETVTALINHLDKKHGKAKVSKVLKKLNIQRNKKAG